MIIFVTGLPGHGKTLNTLAEVDREYGGKRPIYYLRKDAVDTPAAGIAGVNLPNFTPFDDFRKWWDCPVGAVIIIDECQYCFPRRGNSKDKEPEYITAFTEHRKKSFDIYLISQSEMNVDHFIRRIASKHLHFWRVFNSSYSTRWEFPRVVNPFDKTVQKDAVSKKLVRLPANYFDKYSSALEHNVKRVIPFKMLMIPIFLILVFILGYTGYYFLMNRPIKDAKSSPSVPSSVGLSPVKSSPVVNTSNSSTPVIKYKITGIVDLGSKGWIYIDNDGVTIQRDLSTCVHTKIDNSWNCLIDGTLYKNAVAFSSQNSQALPDNKLQNLEIDNPFKKFSSN